MLFNVGDAIPDEPQIARAAVLPSRRVNVCLVWG